MNRIDKFKIIQKQSASKRQKFNSTINESKGLKLKLSFLAIQQKWRK